MFKQSINFLVYLLIVFGVSLAHAGSYEDFFVALERDDASGVAELLKRGFDPNTRNGSAQPALTRAIQAGSMRVVEVLVKHPQAEIDVVNEAGETPLMMAALKGHLALSQRLLEAGAKSHREGWTPLHYAAVGPEPKVVALLLDRGVPIDALSPTRRTALMMAALYGPEESVRLLVARGADVRRRNDLGQHAGDFARVAGRERLAKELDALVR